MQTGVSCLLCGGECRRMHVIKRVLEVDVSGLTFDEVNDIFCAFDRDWRSDVSLKRKFGQVILEVVRYGE